MKNIKIGDQVGFKNRMYHGKKKGDVTHFEFEGKVKDISKNFGGEYEIEDVKMLGTIKKRKVYKK